MFRILKKQKKKINLNEIIKGGFMGFFVGDALGVPYEFISRNDMKKYKVNGMIEFGTHNQPIGTWSDDSSMVLATMDSIINNTDIEYFNYEDMMQRFLEWKNNAKYTATNCVFDIGNTVNDAITKYEKNKDNVFCGYDNINSNGNGSLMRMYPIAIYLSYLIHGYEQETRVPYIFKASSLTHSHILSKLSCYFYCKFVDLIFTNNNLNKEELYNKFRNKIIDYFEKSSNLTNEEKIECKKYFSRLIYSDITKLHQNQINSSGFVIDTLEAAIWCFLTTKNYKEAVLKAVCLGDDTDTVAAITGSLAGSYYGINNIPKEWINVLKRKEYLEGMISNFINVFTIKEEKDLQNRWKRILKTIVPIEKFRELDIYIKLDNEQMNILKKGHIATMMEDHWCMYVDENKKEINLLRSWTHIVIYTAKYNDQNVLYNLKVNDDENVKRKDTDSEEIKKFRNLIEDFLEDAIYNNK